MLPVLFLCSLQNLLKPVLNEAGDNWVYGEYEFNLPKGLDGIHCIGLHLVSPYPEANEGHVPPSG